MTGLGGSPSVLFDTVVPNLGLDRSSLVGEVFGGEVFGREVSVGRFSVGTFSDGRWTVPPEGQE